MASLGVLTTSKDKVSLEDVGAWLQRADYHAEGTTVIDLPNKGLCVDSISLLGTLAMHCQRLRALRLPRNEMGNDAAAALARLLPLVHSPHFHEIDLSANRLTAEGACPIAREFLNLPLGDEQREEPAPELVLQLSDNPLEDHGVSELARLLASHKGIHLRLRNVSCTRNGLNDLVKYKKSIVELDLAENPIGLSGVVAVCSAVASSSCWRTLGLADLLERHDLKLSVAPRSVANGKCPLVEALSDGVKKAAALTSLDCSGNGLGDRGCYAIAEALRERVANGREPLRRLALRSNDCAGRTAKALERTLAGGGLRELDLEGNALNDDAAEALAMGLAACTSMVELQLGFNCISDQGVILLAGGLTAQRRTAAEEAKAAHGGGCEAGCLRDLGLSGNPLGDEGAKALAAAASAVTEEAAARAGGCWNSRMFLQPWGLERLWLAQLPKPGIGTDGLEALRSAVAARATHADTMSQRLEEQKTSGHTAALLEVVQARAKGRPPSGLEVIGLVLDDAEADKVRRDAFKRMQEFWPAPWQQDPCSGLSKPSSSSSKEAAGTAKNGKGRKPVNGVMVLLGPSLSQGPPQPAATPAPLVTDAFGKPVSLACPSTADKSERKEQGPSEQQQRRRPGSGDEPCEEGSVREDYFGKADDTDARVAALPREPPQSKSPGLLGFTFPAKGLNVGSELRPVKAPAVGRPQTQPCSPQPSGKAQSPVGPEANPSEPEREPASDEDTDAKGCTAVSGMGSAVAQHGAVGPPGGCTAPGDGSSAPGSSGGEQSTGAAPGKAPPPKAAKGPGKGKGPAAPAPGAAPGKGKSKGPAPPGAPPAGPAKGAPPAAPPGKGGGKAGPPAPKGAGKAPPAGKAKAPAKASAKAGVRNKDSEAKGVGAAPFGRRIHLAGARYDEPDEHLVFSNLDEDLDFDAEMLAGMFGNEASKTKIVDKMANRRTRPEGVKVLDSSRAQNMAIVLSRLQVSPEELCAQLADFELSDPRVGADNIELLMDMVPNAEECQKLMEFKDKVEELRDVEQKVFPFVLLPKCQARLRLMKLVKTHSGTRTSLLQRCRVLKSASEEVRTSKQLRVILRVVLRVVNYINHGSKDLGKGTMRSFAIESLNAMATFKVGGSASTVHFLAFTTRRSSPKFLEALKQSLKNVREAAREKTSALKQGAQAFNQELTFAQGQLKQIKENSAGRERLALLVSEIEQEAGEIGCELEEAQKSGALAQKYFGVHDGNGKNLPPPVEELFGLFETFLLNFETAWQELDKHPMFKQRIQETEGDKGREGAEGRRASRPKALPRRRASTTAAPSSSQAGKLEGIAEASSASGSAEPTTQMRLTASALGAHNEKTPKRHSWSGASLASNADGLDMDNRSELGSCVGSAIDFSVDDLVNDIFDLADDSGPVLGGPEEVSAPVIDKSQTIVAPCTPKSSQIPDSVSATPDLASPVPALSMGSPDGCASESTAAASPPATPAAVSLPPTLAPVEVGTPAGAPEQHQREAIRRLAQAAGVRREAFDDEGSQAEPPESGLDEPASQPPDPAASQPPAEATSPASPSKGKGPPKGKGNGPPPPSATLAPPEPEPSAPPQPSAAPQPSDSSQPSAAPEPSASPEPFASPEPSAASEPFATPESSATSEPSAASEPCSPSAPSRPAKGPAKGKGKGPPPPSAPSRAAAAPEPAPSLPAKGLSKGRGKGPPPPSAPSRPSSPSAAPADAAGDAPGSPLAEPVATAPSAPAPAADASSEPPCTEASDADCQARAAAPAGDAPAEALTPATAASASQQPTDHKPAVSDDIDVDALVDNLFK